ncbi:MAG: hypothetical protein HQK55_19695, partial [Deltaproteobacteria bacterium]|nr:hypothetical protein [Deltaproteobacteria bacterium]
NKMEPIISQIVARAPADQAMAYLPDLGFVSNVIEKLRASVGLVLNRPNLSVEELATFRKENKKSLETDDHLAGLINHALNLSRFKTDWDDKKEEVIRSASGILPALLLLEPTDNNENLVYDVIDSYLQFTDVRLPVRVDNDYEWFWPWAVSVSVNGGEKAIQMLSRKLAEIGNEIFDSTKGPEWNNHWSAALQEILLEAIFLSRTYSKQDEEAKQKALLEALKLNSPHVQRLAGAMLKRSVVSSNRRSIRDYKILLLYIKERFAAGFDKVYDYTPAVSLDKIPLLLSSGPSTPDQAMESMEEIRQELVKVVSQVEDESYKAAHNLLHFFVPPLEYMHGSGNCVFLADEFKKKILEASRANRQIIAVEEIGSHSNVELVGNRDIHKKFFHYFLVVLFRGHLWVVDPSWQQFLPNSIPLLNNGFPKVMIIEINDLIKNFPKMEVLGNRNIWQEGIIENSEIIERLKRKAQEQGTRSEEKKVVGSQLDGDMVPAGEGADDAKNGGIDLTRDKMGLQVQSVDAGLQFKFDPAMIEQLQSASGRADGARHVVDPSLRSLRIDSGLTPVIIDIQPMTTTLPMFLGLKDDAPADLYGIGTSS